MELENQLRKVNKEYLQLGRYRWLSFLRTHECKRNLVNYQFSNDNNNNLNQVLQCAFHKYIRLHYMFYFLYYIYEHKR